MLWERCGEGNGDPEREKIMGNGNRRTSWEKGGVSKKHRFKNRKNIFDILLVSWKEWPFAAGCQKKSELFEAGSFSHVKASERAVL